MDLLNVLSFTVGVFGVGLSIYFGREAKRLAVKIKSIAWEDIVLAASDLASEITRNFDPDIIYAPDCRGGIIGMQIRQGMRHEILLITGVTLWKENISSAPELPGYSTKETTKWFVITPDVLSSFSGKKILVVDDFAMSGDALVSIKNNLVEDLGFKKENVKTCAVIVSETAKRSNKYPDFSWKTVEHHDFFFPWGNAK